MRYHKAFISLSECVWPSWFSLDIYNFTINFLKYVWKILMEELPTVVTGI